MRRTIILSFCLIVMFASLVLAGIRDDTAATASVTPAFATIGENVKYKIIVKNKSLKEIEVFLPDKKEKFPDKVKDDKNPEKPGESAVPLYVIQDAVKNEVESGNTKAIEITVNIIFYRAGKYQLPDIDILNTDKRKIGYKIPEIEIKSLNIEGKLEEIEAPLDLSGNHTRLYILILTIIAVGLAGYFVYRRIKSGKPFLPAPRIKLSPMEVFNNEIRALDPESLIAKGDIEGYVFGISIIFRRLLSNLLKFDAHDMTSEEINGKLKIVFTKEMFNKYYGQIIKCFELWDISKYAEFAPGADILSDNLAKTINLARELSRDVDHVIS
jgi:hypothetical protein